jgi:hypothetical protein
MTNYLADAWAAVPGLTSLEAAHARAKALQIEPVTRRLKDVTADIEQALIEEKPVDALLAEIPAVIAAEADSKTIDAQRAVVASRLRDRVDVTQSEGVDHALRYLGRELAKLVKRLRPLAPTLQKIAGPTEALRAGPEAIDAWKTFDLASQDYTELRAAQRKLIDRGYGAVERRYVDEHLTNVGQVRGGTRTIQPTQLIGLDQRGLANMQRHPDQENDWPTDLTEQLAWAIRTGAELWVPTLGELRTAAAQVKRIDRGATLVVHHALERAIPEPRTTAETTPNAMARGLKDARGLADLRRSYTEARD